MFSNWYAIHDCANIWWYIFYIRSFYIKLYIGNNNTSFFIPCHFSSSICLVFICLKVTMNPNSLLYVFTLTIYHVWFFPTKLDSDRDKLNPSKLSLVFWIFIFAWPVAADWNIHPSLLHWVPCNSTYFLLFCECCWPLLLLWKLRNYQANSKIENLF